MGKQIFNFKGMMRDLSVSKNPSNYAYEIRNMRLTAQEDSTLLSLVTEKGNREFAVKDASNNPVALDNIIGYCVIDKYLTVFTHKVENTSCIDSIVRLEEKYPEGSSISYMEAKVLYTGDLDLYPDKGVEIDALGCYENENLIKVYWVDSVHQPRLINIMASDDEISSWSDMETPFDFIPALGFNEEVSIQKVNYNGLFAPGTLQYVLTYYKRNGQQSNSFYTSPLYYTAHSNRGGSPEETVSNAFEIKVYNPDTAFDFVRVYSVLRTSQDDAPVCKRVYDIPLTSLLLTNEQIPTISLIQSTSGSQGNIITTDIDLLQIVKMEVLQNNFYNMENMEVCNLHDFLVERSSEGLDGYDYILTHEYGIVDTTNNIIYYPDTNNDSGLKLTVIDSDSSLYIQSESAIIKGIKIDDYEIIIPLGYAYKVRYYEGNFTTGYKQLAKSYVNIIDNGIIGDTCDLSEILYSGGQVIIPKTLAQKNNTCFFGNYKEDIKIITEDNKTAIKDGINIEFYHSDSPVSKGSTGSYYMYNFQLNDSSREITGFKGGEWYLFGLVLQDKNGIWSDVIPLNTVFNELYPEDYDDYFYPVKAKIKIHNNTVRELLSDFVNIKVVAHCFNTVVCQGALNPTIFNYDREDNNPYAMSSWFYRDVTASSRNDYRPQAKHYHNIRDNGSDGIGEYKNYAGEIQFSSINDIWYYDPNNTNHNPFDMFVDCNIVTLNSPELDDYGSSLSDKNIGLKVVGALPITAGITSKRVDMTSNPLDYNTFSITDNTIINSHYSNDGYKMNLCSYWITDKLEDNSIVKFNIYPWNRAVSLTSKGYSDSTYVHNEYENKIQAALRSSGKSIFFDTSSIVKYSGCTLGLYRKEDALPVYLKVGDDIKTYKGSVDTLLSDEVSHNLYCWYLTPSGSQTTSYPISYSTCSGTDAAVPLKYKSASHAVICLSGELSDTIEVIPNTSINSNEYSVSDIDTINRHPIKYIINDASNISETQTTEGDLRIQFYSVAAASVTEGDIILMTNTGTTDYDGFLFYVVAHSPLNQKIVADKLTYHNALGIVNQDCFVYDGGHTEFHIISETQTVYNVQELTLKYYYGYFKYIDLLNSEQHNFKARFGISTDIRKYGTKSKKNGKTIITYNTDLTTETTTYWQISVTNEGTTDIDIKNISVKSISTGLTIPYIFCAELYEKNPVLDVDYNSVDWFVASESVKSDYFWPIKAELGDTYYQRYDSLKTSYYTKEDKNQIIEIFSFMCETKINIDGRYDIFRGMSDNTIIPEELFNSINKAYTQKNNIYSYRYLDADLFGITDFPTRVIWTKTKNYGEEIDSWTQIQTISELDMDGVLGPVSTLRLFNDNLLCWQSKGLARIQYNERNAISTSSGVPVELANSGKVDGKNYISTSVGTDNMMSVQITPTGVYFVDTNTKDIYQFSGDGLVSISKAKGFNTYMNNSSLDLKRSRTFYDPKLQDVYFENAFTSKTECLVFNEQLKEFTSFFDYDMSFLFPLQDSVIAIKGHKLYKQFDGDYLDMFGVVKDYSVEFISNEYPIYDKIFTNFELRADVLNPDTGALVGTTTPYTSSANLYPFKTMKVWNEYQNTGNVNFEEMIRKGTNMSQRFRIWRGDIPRDSEKKFDRIRNTWARVKLTGDNKKIKTVLHDVNIIYYQ